MSDDTVTVMLPLDMDMSTDLGDGMDTVKVSGPMGTQVRLTFTSAEVGNSMAMDGGMLANQDGGLAVRLQAEDGMDMPMGPVARFDDEGIRFVAASEGLMFDVRDLVSGVARGDMFSIAQLGTMAGDLIGFRGEMRNVYVNAGMGNDTVKGGDGMDFLVGGAGDDLMRGRNRADSFIGGGGNDMIFGGGRGDTAILNPATDGMDMIDLGVGRDMVAVGGMGQVRLTFTSAEVGNGMAMDGGMMSNQDGGLAVRLQAEDMDGMLTGGVTRTDDEGIRFVATGGATFDVRDLVSGTARGDMFTVAELGTVRGERISHDGSMSATYVNAGAGDDVVIGGMADDFLVGGAGNDVLRAGAGMDSLIGGAGMDRFVFRAGDGDDTILDFAAGDMIDLTRLRVEFADLMITMDGGMTMVGIDRDGDMMADMTLTLTNGAMLTEADFAL